MENNRAFQLWYYTVSHSHMLIRQPKNSADGYNTDYFFTSVEYLQFPSMMHSLTISLADDEATKQFLTNLSIENGKAYEYGLKLYLLECDEGNYYIVAGSMSKSENQDEMMDITKYNPLK